MSLLPQIIKQEFTELIITHFSDGNIKYVGSNGMTYIPYDEHNKYDYKSSFDTKAKVDLSEFFQFDLQTYEIILFASICFLLVIIGGITSGLNVSLLSIDETKINIFQNSDNLEKRKMIKKLKPIIIDRHFLLVTLLVANAGAMEALPIFLEKLVQPWLAIIVSVTFVLIFGEVIPQALFSSDPLLAGFKLRHIVNFFKIVLYPICRPIAWLLDKCMPSQHAVLLTGNEITEILNLVHFCHPDQKKNFYKVHYICMIKLSSIW